MPRSALHRVPHLDVSSVDVEGLLYRMILAVSGLASKATTFLGASKLANRDGEAIYDGEARVTVSPAEYGLPKSLFQLPQIGRLSNKSGTMKLCQSREEVSVVPAEVVEQSLVLAQSEVLANNFNSEDFAISKAWLRPAMTKAASAEMSADSIVNEAQ